MIGSNITKNISLTNSIEIDGVQVAGQSATINATSGAISFSSWVNDYSLYKANRAAIRQEMAAFEDLAYEEQDNGESAEESETE